MFVFRYTILFAVIAAKGKKDGKRKKSGKKYRNVLQPIASKQVNQERSPVSHAPVAAVPGGEVFADKIEVDYAEEYDQDYQPVVGEISDTAFQELLSNIASADNVVTSDNMANDYVPEPTTSEYEEEEEEGILNYSDGLDERSFFNLAMFDYQTTDDSQDDSSDEPANSPENDRMGMYAPDPSSYQSQGDFTGPSDDDGRTGNDMFNACFTCDATGNDATSMLASCQTSGKLVECAEDSMCSIEVRKRNGNFVGMRTLCKSTVACENQHKQNFGPGSIIRQQCRPEDNLTNRRFGPSVCRQCFQTCEGTSSTNTGVLCFSTSTGIPTLSGSLTSFDLFNPGSTCTTSSCTEFGRSWWDAGLNDCQNDGTLAQVSDCNNGAFPPGYNTYSPTVHLN